jgi:hypothetical protein
MAELSATGAWRATMKFTSTNGGDNSICITRLTVEDDLGHFSWKFGTDPSSLNLSVSVSYSYPVMNFFPA